MSRRIDPAYYSDDGDGWEHGRREDGQAGRNRSTDRRRVDSRKHAYGKGKGARRNREGWDGFDGT